MARALGADNAFGTQLDSLADRVSFGVVPAMALYDWRLGEAGPLGIVAACALVLAGLMVSPWSYRSFKDRSLWGVAIPAGLGIAAVVAGVRDPVAGFGLALVLGGVAYALSAPVARLARALR